MKKFNVIQKCIAFVATCVSLVAILALSGNGYSEWAFYSDFSANIYCDGGVTDWYHSVTVYDLNKNIIWQKTDYNRGDTVEISDEADSVSLENAVYGYIEENSLTESTVLTDENGTEVATLTAAEGELVLVFGDIDLSVAKDYKFYIKVT